MLCVSVPLDTGKRGIKLLEEALRVGDAVEIRLDKGGRKKGSRFLKYLPKPVLFTYRTKEQGGEGVELRDAVNLILGYLRHKNAYVDVEYKWPEDIKGAFQRFWGQKVILSHHILDYTPDIQELERFYKEMASSRPFAVKIVGYARCLEDNLTIKRFLSAHGISGPKLISFLMGPLGVVSRVLCVKWGSYMSFACLKGLEMADGQIPGLVMRELWEDENVFFR